MTDKAPSVFVFCALASEAKPLIQAWQLQRLSSPDHPFAVYTRRDRAVIVTGIGKINMAGAVAYTLALFDNPPSPVLINLGVAGHRNEALGGLCLGHKIIDTETGRCFYPQMPFAVSCATYSVLTGGHPQVDYAVGELYEMEAAGFYELAIKFSSSELIQVLKIVSDNAASSIANITEASVEEWVARQLATIDAIVAQLIGLRQASQHAISAEYHELTCQFHFTVSRSLKLKALLQRWRILKGDEGVVWRNANLRNAKELLIWLESQLEDVEFYL